MSLEDKINKINGGSRKAGLLKALGGIGLLMHSAFHLFPLIGVGYLAFGGNDGLMHGHEAAAGIGHYFFDFLGIGFAIWGIYYAYKGIREYLEHRKHGHNGYLTEYAH